jgi:hypothetical protein
MEGFWLGVQWQEHYMRHKFLFSDGMDGTGGFS